MRRTEERKRKYERVRVRVRMDEEERVMERGVIKSSQVLTKSR